MNYITDTQPSTVAGVARSAMMVDLHISVYSGRKQDKTTQGEVTTAKGSGSKKAASVYKNLFAECKELDDLTKFQARARAEHYRLTLPWNDQGARLLPTASLLEYQQTMGRYRNEFERLVDAFLDKYDTLVAAAAFQLQCSVIWSSSTSAAWRPSWHRLTKTRGVACTKPYCVCLIG
jgi:hypothetical protein